MNQNKNEQLVIEKEQSRTGRNNTYENLNKNGNLVSEVEIDPKQEQAESRKKQNEEKKRRKKPRRRLFPIWLRVIVVLLLFAASLMIGLMVGYGVLGDGNPTDALKKETWQHILELITGD